MLFTAWEDEQYIIDNAEQLYTENEKQILAERSKYYSTGSDDIDTAMREKNGRIG